MMDDDIHNKKILVRESSLSTIFWRGESNQEFKYRFFHSFIKKLLFKRERKKLVIVLNRLDYTHFMTRKWSHKWLSGEKIEKK